MDHTQGFGSFRPISTNEYHFPQHELFGGLNFDDYHDS
jgi:hypothetical protein